MFGSSLSPVVCRRALVLFTLCSGRLYLQLFVGGSCLIYVMFGSSLSPVVCRRLLSYLRYVRSSLSPVVCRRALVLFTLCSLRLYLQSCFSYLCLGLLSYLGGVMFGSSLPPVVCRRLLSYLRYVRFVFTSSCL